MHTMRRARQRNRLLACLPLLVVATLFGCAGSAVDGGTDIAASTAAPVVLINATSSPTPGASADAAAQPTPSFAGAPDETPSVTPAPTPNISVTTGRVLPEDRRFQPVLAVIGNAPKVRPQTGLMQADIIYEISLDRTDHATRLVALFSDRDPVRVGPIQDARFPFFDLRREWNAMMVYSGYPADEGYPVFDRSIIDIPADYSEETARFFLQDKTVSDLPENTLFCRITDMKNDLYGRASVAASNARFSFAAGVQPSNGKPFLKVGLPFTSSDYARAEFVYHADDNMLYRLEKNSKGTLVPTKSLTVPEDGAAIKSEPLCVQNLIVQYVKYEDIISPYRSAALISNGKCDYFINGRHAAGTWSRTGVTEPTVYSMRDGSPLVLEPGTTWIVFQSLQREIKVQYG